MAYTGVEFVRSELSLMIPHFDIVDDVVDEKVKEKGTLYLPMPNPKEDDCLDRYTAYKQRAVLYNATGRTLAGLVGQIFSNAPEVELPGTLANLQGNSDGENISLVQSAKGAADNVLRHGRCGIYTDYTKLDHNPTQQEIQEGVASPIITVHGARDVTNWKYYKKGGKRIYTLVVIRESYEKEPDPADIFKVENDIQFRVLKIVDDRYIVEIHRKMENGSYDVFETREPKDSNGKPFKEIPFSFIGAVNNDPEPDLPPLLSLANINIAHYRNSADYEEACFIVGQPTYIISGLDKAWYEEVLKKKINVGSRGGIALPTGADGKILQVSPNTMPKEAMEHKEKQMVALGAKLVESDAAAQTATEPNIHNAAETSVLATIARNVSAGFSFALKFAARFAGEPEAQVKFALNTDFAITKLSPEERNALIAEWQAGAITFSEMRAKLKGAGVATLEDKEARTEIDKDADRESTQAADAAKKLADAVPPKVPVNA